MMGLLFFQQVTIIAFMQICAKETMVNYFIRCIV